VGSDAETIGAAQLRILAEAREYLRSLKSRGVDVAIDAMSYLCSWAAVPGYVRLRLMAEGWKYFPTFAYRVARDVALISVHSEPKVAGGEGRRGGYDQVVVSWARKGDYQADGSYFDRYFQTSSREVPRTLWFLISLDNYVPDKLDTNIRLFARDKSERHYDFGFLLRTVARVVKESGGSPRRTMHRLSTATVLAEEVAAALSSELEGSGASSLLLPYEAQPFHHAVFRAAKNADPSIRTVGYLHSALPPLPTDLIRRDGAPDLVLVHGAEQMQMMESHLGWTADSLRAIPSLRYRAEESASFAGEIFLPYSFGTQEIVVNAFAAYLRDLAPRSLPLLKVRNHPVMMASRRHLRLKAALEATMAKYRDRFTADPSRVPVSVFIGATASIVEALERGLEVIHVCSYPLFESHNEELWKLFKVERFGPYLFRYALRAQGKYIQLGDERDMFTKYCKGV
jgi:hypothetical protein